MNTRIAGIPCRVLVTAYHPGVSARTCAEVDDCFEGEAPELEFAVLDQRGRPAPWLAAKLTAPESARIERELLTYCQGI